MRTMKGAIPKKKKGGVSLSLIVVQSSFIMLPGVARKLAIPFVLVCIVGWITFIIGFILRNLYYRDRTEALTRQGIQLDNAAASDFLMLWLFAVSCPVILVFTFINIFWDHAVSKLLVNILLPIFLVGAGGTLMFDAFYIYTHYQLRNNGNFHVICGEVNDFLGDSNGGLDIHVDQKFAPVEFSGVVTTVLFYWIYLIVSSFFASEKSRSV